MRIAGLPGIGDRRPDIGSAITTRSPIPDPGSPTNDDARLRQSVQNLEGLFVEQLFKAMRETVPQNEGAVGGGTGEDMFTGLMDQHLAADTPTQWAHGLSAAAYRQLRSALADPATQSPPSAQPPTAPLPLR